MKKVRAGVWLLVAIFLSYKQTDPRPLQKTTAEIQSPSQKALQAGDELTKLNLTTSEETCVTSAARGDLHAVELFLAAGLSPNSQNQDGFTPLIWSAGQGHRLVVERLLATGADVNAKSKDRTTALMAAASQGYTPIVELLLNKGSNLEARRADGWTALIWSAAEGQEASVDLLLAKGANINAADAGALEPIFLRPS